MLLGHPIQLSKPTREGHGEFLLWQQLRTTISKERR